MSNDGEQCHHDDPLYYCLKCRPELFTHAVGGGVGEPDEQDLALARERTEGVELRGRILVALDLAARWHLAATRCAKAGRRLLRGGRTMLAERDTIRDALATELLDGAKVKAELAAVNKLKDELAHHRETGGASREMVMVTLARVVRDRNGLREALTLLSTSCERAAKTALDYQVRSVVLDACRVAAAEKPHRECGSGAVVSPCPCAAETARTAPVASRAAPGPAKKRPPVTDARSTTSAVHMSVSVRGMLGWPRKKLSQATRWMLRPDGSRYSIDTLRDALFDELAAGHEVLPLSANCEGFDFKTGCPGHHEEEALLAQEPRR